MKAWKMSSEIDLEAAKEKYSHIASFFTLKEIKNADSINASLVFECIKCLPKIQSINSTSQAPYSNLKTHIKRVHNSDLENFEFAITDKKKKSATPAPVASTSRSNPFELAKLAKNQPNLTQKEFNNAIADLITSENLPLTITRRLGWRKFLKKVQPRNQIPCYETNVKTIEDRFELMMNKIKESLKKPEYLACSTDGWSARKKHFLGYTSTWLDEDFKRSLVTLACRRFVGSQTYSTLTPHMCKILEEFSIERKTQGFTTDSASNYIKAFVEFGLDPLDKLEDDDVDDSDKDECVAMDIDSGLVDRNDSDEDDEFILPPHLKCSSHKFNNVGKLGCQKAMKTKSFSKVAHVVFGKVRGIWNAQSRSTIKADKIREICGGVFVEPGNLNENMYFVICILLTYTLPGETRWNGFFDGMTDFLDKLKKSPDRLASVAKELGFRSFTENEIQFVEEFLKVMKPVALALDNLQGDVGLGHILPTVSDVYACFEGKNL